MTVSPWLGRPRSWGLEPLFPEAESVQQRQSCASGQLGGWGQCWVPHTEEGLASRRLP